MDILYQENVILMMLALFFSALITTVWGYGYDIVSHSLDGNENDRKLSLASENFLCRIPHEWVFVQELEDIIFGCLTEEDGNGSCEDFAFLYETRDFKPDFQALLEKILKHLEESGRIERSSVVYSRENLQKNPELFTALPGWLKANCEESLLITSSYSSGEGLVRVRKTFSEKTSRDAMMKNIGMGKRTHI